MENTYQEAIQTAQENYEDLQSRGDEAIGGDAAELLNSLLSPEDKADVALKLSLLEELTEARREKGLSQKRLAELSGVSSAIIARMEKGTANPRLSTLMKTLMPLGMTLAIVPLNPDA